MSVSETAPPHRNLPSVQRTPVEVLKVALSAVDRGERKSGFGRCCVKVRHSLQFHQNQLDDDGIPSLYLPRTPEAYRAG